MRLTALSRHSKSLALWLKDLQVPANHAVFYTISAAVSPLHLEDMISTLGHKNHVGCITSTAPQHYGMPSCSIATFPTNLIVPFHSTLGGKEPVSLGRWRRPSSRNLVPNNSAPLEEVLPVLPNLEGGLKKFSLPVELDSVRRDLRALVFLSDSAPEGLLEAINEHLPRIPKLGLIGASTPFLTGRDHTLFMGQHVVSSGAVGFGLLGNPPRQENAFEGLVPISDVYVVTSAMSNLIYSIDGKNPIREALVAYDSVGNRDRPKDIAGLALGVVDEANNGSFHRVYGIVSGGPSRGTMALDGDDGPPIGSRIQFLARGNASSPPTLSREGEIRMTSVPKMHDLSPDRPVQVEEDVVVHNHFSGFSDNGVIMASNGLAWLSTLPGSSTAFR